MSRVNPRIGAEQVLNIGQMTDAAGRGASSIGCPNDVGAIERGPNSSVGTLERRLRTLAELVAHAALVTRPEHACARALETLARQLSELEWASVYLTDIDGILRHAGGIESLPGGVEWPLAEAAAAAMPIIVESQAAVLVPLRAANDAPQLGVLVVGLEPHVRPDDALLAFLMQVGQSIGAAVAIAAIRSQAEKHVQIMALQDHALQTFFVIGLLARAALADVAAHQVSDSAAAALVQIIDAATTGREHLREAVFALGHREVGRSGIIEDLRRLARTFQERTGIDAEVLVQGTPRELPAAAIEALHHAASEALENIERHSQAGAVVLSLQIARTSVTLSIQDDGVGIANPTLERIASSATHFGLRGVGIRVRRLGGTFVAHASRDGGFVVRTRIPLKSTRR